MPNSSRKTARLLTIVFSSAGVAFACGERVETSTSTVASTTDDSASVDDTTDPGDESSDTQTSADGSSSTSSSTEISDSATDSVGGAGPMIVLLTATPPEITDDDVVTILAQVVDPDGSEDIVGGLLKNEAGDATYGAFMQISEGSFNLVLDWNTINAIEPITYDEDAARTFVAEFTDTAANAAIETVEVRFDCEGLAICDGECTELGTEANCSACGDVCGGAEYCMEGTCVPTPSGCGDGMISPGEQCDGRDLQGFDCESLGLEGGVLGCDPVMCTFDTSNCTA